MKGERLIESTNMKIMIVVGARPNFMKAAPLIAAIREHNQRTVALSPGEHAIEADQIEGVLVHTGQHYDEALSGSFFADLGLPQPDVHLGGSSHSHQVQTAEIMQRFEVVLMRKLPEVVVVMEEFNSTLD